MSGSYLRNGPDATPSRLFCFQRPMDGVGATRNFDRVVNKTANMLRLHGIAKGDVVSLLMPNSVEYVIAYFACWKLGAIAGPINSLLKAQEISYVLSDSETTALLVHSDFLPTIESLRKELPGLQAVITFDDEVVATESFKDDSNRTTSTNLSFSMILAMDSRLLRHLLRASSPMTSVLLL